MENSKVKFEKIRLDLIFVIKEFFREETEWEKRRAVLQEKRLRLKIQRMDLMPTVNRNIFTKRIVVKSYYPIEIANTIIDEIDKETEEVINELRAF